MKISERLNKFVDKLKSWHSGVARTMVRWSPLRAKESRNPLVELTPQRARDLYKLWREGKYADVMLAWDALEEFDETLATVVDRRLSALCEMYGEVVMDGGAIGDDETKKVAAEAQMLAMNEYFGRVQNMSDAVKFLGMATFRGFAHLEVVERGRDIYFLPIDQWLMARTERRGAWFYNADANASCAKLEEVDETRLIIRECARPVDLAAMGAICAKQHAVDGWDGFIDTYGNPAIFFEYPPGTSEERARAYDEVVGEIIGEGRGGFPSGGKITTVETQARGGETFEARADWCNKQIVRRATGGELTVLAEAGSGTLAGNAHADTFRMLAAGEGSEISDVINRTVVRKFLNEKFPGQVHLVYWQLKFGEDDTEKRINYLVQLGQLGYRADDAVVSDLVGLTVNSTGDFDARSIYAAKSAGYVPVIEEMQKRMGMVLKDVPTEADMAAAQTDGAIQNRDKQTDIETQHAASLLGELTPAEVAVLEGLAGIEPSEARAAALADAMEKEMASAMQAKLRETDKVKNNVGATVLGRQTSKSRKMPHKGLENGLPKVDTPSTNKRPTANLQRLCNEMAKVVEDGEEENEDCGVENGKCQAKNKPCIKCNPKYEKQKGTTREHKTKKGAETKPATQAQMANEIQRVADSGKDSVVMLHGQELHILKHDLDHIREKRKVQPGRMAAALFKGVQTPDKEYPKTRTNYEYKGIKVTLGVDLKDPQGNIDARLRIVTAHEI